MCLLLISFVRHVGSWSAGFLRCFYFAFFSENLVLCWKDCFHPSVQQKDSLQLFPGRAVMTEVGGQHPKDYNSFIRQSKVDALE